MEVREVLEGMLDILHEKEWIQGHLYKGTGSSPDDLFIPREEVQGVCLEGACHLAFSAALTPAEMCDLKTLVNQAVINAAADSCPEKYQDYMKVMFQFNDFEKTTREDVILAVKTAIANLENND